MRTAVNEIRWWRHPDCDTMAIGPTPTSPTSPDADVKEVTMQPSNATPNLAVVADRAPDGRAFATR